MDSDPAPTSPAPAPCPFCGGVRTEVMSLFGSHASLTTCWCADCRSPFEILRWKDAAKSARGDDEAGKPRPGHSSTNSSAV